MNDLLAFLVSAIGPVSALVFGMIDRKKSDRLWARLSTLQEIEAKNPKSPELKAALNADLEKVVRGLRRRALNPWWNELAGKVAAVLALAGSGFIVWFLMKLSEGPQPNFTFFDILSNVAAGVVPFAAFVWGCSVCFRNFGAHVSQAASR